MCNEYTGRVHPGTLQKETQEGHPIISCGPKEMIGQAYYRPATATDTVLEHLIY